MQDIRVSCLPSQTVNQLVCSWNYCLSILYVFKLMRHVEWQSAADLSPVRNRLSPFQNIPHTSLKSFPIYGQKLQCFLRKKKYSQLKPCFSLALANKKTNIIALFSTIGLRSTEIAEKFHVQLVSFKFGKGNIQPFPSRLRRSFLACSENPLKEKAHWKTKCQRTASSEQVIYR